MSIEIKKLMFLMKCIILQKNTKVILKYTITTFSNLITKSQLASHIVRGQDMYKSIINYSSNKLINYIYTFTKN